MNKLLLVVCGLSSISSLWSRGIKDIVCEKYPSFCERVEEFHKIAGEHCNALLARVCKCDPLQDQVRAKENERYLEWLQFIEKEVRESGNLSEKLENMFKEEKERAAQGK